MDICILYKSLSFSINGVTYKCKHIMDEMNCFPLNYCLLTYKMFLNCFCALNIPNNLNLKSPFKYFLNHEQNPNYPSKRSSPCPSLNRGSLQQSERKAKKQTSSRCSSWYNLFLSQDQSMMRQSR